MISVKLINFSLQKGICSGSKNKLTIISSVHSGTAVKGSDVVCAAVSALIQTMILSISRILKIRQKLVQQDGFLSSEIVIDELGEEENKNLKFLIESFLLGIFEIQKQYPDKIKIEFVTD